MRQSKFSISDNPSLVYRDTLIIQGENNATQLEITIDGEYVGYTYTIIFQLNDDLPILITNPNIIDSVLIYQIPNPLTLDYGNIEMEIQCYAGTTIVKSKTFKFKVKHSADGTSTIPMPEEYVPWYQDVAELKPTLIQIISDSNGVFANCTQAANTAYNQASYAGQKASEASVAAGSANNNALRAETAAINCENILGSLTTIDSILAEIEAEI